MLMESKALKAGRKLRAKLGLSGVVDPEIVAEALADGLSSVTVPVAVPGDTDALLLPHVSPDATGNLCMANDQTLLP